MDLNYGTASYDRGRGNFPVLPMINMFVESSPTEPQPVIVSRPGVDLSASPNLGTTVPTVRPHGMFYVDGVLSNDWFVVTSDNKLYKGNPTSGFSSVGTTDGAGNTPVSWGAYSNNIFLAAGASLWKYDGATLAAVATPGGFSVRAVCIGASRVIVIDDGTGKLFWSDALGTTLPALNFATAENSPDKLVDCLYVGDTLVLFGTETVELWPSTQDGTSPFAPLIGSALNAGCRDTGCATMFNRTFAWITNHNNICVTNTNNVISEPWLEEKLALSTSALLWTFWLEGTEFLAVRLDTHTYVFSSKSQQWSEFATNAQTNWEPISFANGYFGSGASGTILRFLDESFSNGAFDEDIAFERRFRAGLPITTGALRVDNLTLRVNEGYATAYSVGKPTELQNPTVQLRTSRDGGNTWSSWISKSLGVNGSYRIPPQWRSLGTYGFPGLIVEIKVTDRVPFRVSGAKINEPYGTR